MLRLAIRAAQALLLVVCIAMLWGIFAPLSALSVPEARFAATPTNAGPTGQASFRRYSIIGTRNLFQTSAAALPVQQVIVESKTQLRLVGTLAASDDTGGVAIVEFPPNRRQVVKIGTKLDGGMVVERIERRRLVVNNNGKLEQISNMGELAPGLALLGGRLSTNQPKIVEYKSAYRAVARSSERDQQDNPKPAPTQEALEPRGRPVLPETRSVEFLSADDARRMAEKGFQGPRVEIQGPVRPGGGDARYSAVAGDELLKQLLAGFTLAEGERVLAVNGVSVSDVDRLPELLGSLQGKTPARVRIAVNSTTEREIEVRIP